jgi:hypothetical protein
MVKNNPDLPFECAWCGLQTPHDKAIAIEHAKTCAYRPEHNLLKTLDWYAVAEEGKRARDGGRRAREALKRYEKLMEEGY